MPQSSPQRHPKPDGNRRVPRVMNFTPCDDAAVLERYMAHAIGHKPTGRMYAPTPARRAVASAHSRPQDSCKSLRHFFSFRRRKKALAEKIIPENERKAAYELWWICRN